MAVTVSTGALLGAAAIAAGASAAGSGMSLFSNWQANQKNEALNRENLAFQRETFEYQKALQQQIFEREDTAYQRAAADAQQVGINPMALAGSGGANAGQAIDVTTPQNNMQYKSIAEGIDLSAPIVAGLNAMEGLNQVLTGNQTRDLLQAQIDNQRFETLYNAMAAGFDYDPKSGSFVYNPNNPIKHPDFETKQNTARDTAATANRNERVDTNQKIFGHDDTSNTYARLATDIANQAGRAGGYVSSAAKKAYTGYMNSGYVKAISAAQNAIGNSLSSGYKKLANFMSKAIKGNSSKKSKQAVKGNMR